MGESIVWLDECDGRLLGHRETLLTFLDCNHFSTIYDQEEEED